MPAFTLYAARGSSNAYRIRLTLAEGGFADYETVLLDLAKSEQKSKEHLERHPWGKVPAVTFPDGFTLYESRSICKYVARKYSFPLLPDHLDLEAQALFDQAESVEMLYFTDPAAKLGFEKFAKKLIGIPTDEAVVTKSLKELEKFFDTIDPLLQQKGFMAGNGFTLVDIYYIPLVQRLFACGYGEIITNRKAVNAWWKRCMERPAIQKLLAADREAMAAAMAKRKHDAVSESVSR